MMGAKRDQAIGSVLEGSDKGVPRVFEEDVVSRDRSALYNRGNVR